MADQKLTARTELTTSTDAALLHVVEAGVSYKQTKLNLLKEVQADIDANIASIATKGDVSKSGTPTAGQFAVWVSDGVVQGYTFAASDFSDIVRTTGNQSIDAYIQFQSGIEIAADSNLIVGDGIFYYDTANLLGFGTNEMIYGTDTGGMHHFIDSSLLIYNSVKAGDFRIDTLNSAPTSATDTGTTGEIRFTADYIYLCVATNTWKRVGLSTW